MKIKIEYKSINGGETPIEFFELEGFYYSPCLGKDGETLFFKVYTKEFKLVRVTTIGYEFNRLNNLYKRLKIGEKKDKESTLPKNVINDDVSKWQWID